LGRRGTELGQRGPQAHARGEAAGLEASRAKRREVLGRLRRKKRGEGEGFPFLKILFNFIFQTFKLQSNKNPCIRIMMHKHLLFLNYFSDIKYLKANLFDNFFMSSGKLNLATCCLN
jgi:hypothetical protein